MVKKVASEASNDIIISSFLPCQSTQQDRVLLSKVRALQRRLFHGFQLTPEAEKLRNSIRSLVPETFVCPQLIYAPSLFGFDSRSMSKKLFTEASVDSSGSKRLLWSRWKLAVTPTNYDMKGSLEKRMVDWRTVYSLLQFQRIWNESFHNYIPVPSFDGLRLESVPTISTLLLLDQIHHNTVKLHSVELILVNARPLSEEYNPAVASRIFGP